MQIYIDTTDAGEIKRYRETGLIDGVTTNPGSFGANGTGANPVELFDSVVEAAAGLPVFVQVRARAIADQVEEATRLKARYPNVVIKVIIDEIGYQSIPLMVQAGLTVSATAVNSAGRAILAAEAGAHFMIPYFGWLEDSHDHATNLVADVAAIYAAQHYETKMHIFCRRSSHVIEAAKAGVWGVLMEPNDLNCFFDHPHTAAAVDGHRASWDGKYGHETTWLDFLNR
jgi:transaldolase